MDNYIEIKYCIPWMVSFIVCFVISFNVSTDVQLMEREHEK